MTAEIISADAAAWIALAALVLVFVIAVNCKDPGPDDRTESEIQQDEAW